MLRAGAEPSCVTLLTGAPVMAVRWSRGAVEVETPRGRFAAPRAIVTLPVGVLRAPGAVRFEPELGAHRTALERLEMAPVAKVLLRFRAPFWEKRARDIGMVHVSGTRFPTWWSAMPVTAPMLTAWSGGPRARALLAGSPESVVEAAVTEAAQVFGEPLRAVRAGLLGAHFHDWSADPWSRGAYSYVGVGGVRSSKALRRPVEGTLFFAGEATADESGTVEGAIETGRRAADEVIAAVRA